MASRDWFRNEDWSPEIAEAFDTPDDHVFEMAQTRAFAGQPLGRPILGSIESLKPADRASVTDWRRRLYAPNRMVVAVSGAVDEAELLNLAELWFDEADGEVLGYWVAMAGVDELHLLNLTVTTMQQGAGHGRFMLDALCRLGVQRGAVDMGKFVNEHQRTVKRQRGNQSRSDLDRDTARQDRNRNPGIADTRRNQHVGPVDRRLRLAQPLGQVARGAQHRLVILDHELDACGLRGLGVDGLVHGHFWQILRLALPQIGGRAKRGLLVTVIDSLASMARARHRHLD